MNIELINKLPILRTIFKIEWRAKYIAKRNHLSFPSNPSEILQKYQKVVAPLPFVFTKKWELLTNTPELCLSYHNQIYFNYGWAAYIILHDNDFTMNAFRISIGHEFTHSKGDFKIKSSRKLTRTCKKFVSWTNEIHADFGGVQCMGDNKRENLINSIQFKINIKKNPNRSFISHPSWKARLFYAKNYDFDSSLIKKIANDTGCTNSNLICDVCMYFQDIYLH